MQRYCSCATEMDIPAIHEQRSSEEQPPLQSSLAPEWNSSMQEFAVQSQPLQALGTKRVLRDVESQQPCVSRKNSEFEATDSPGEGVPEKKMKTTGQAQEGYNLETQLEDQLQNESAVPGGEAPGNRDAQQPPARAQLPDENVASAMQRINSEAREIYSTWQETFKESETFELFCPARLDELIKEARALDNSLREQKERLKGRLEVISRTLL